MRKYLLLMGAFVLAVSSCIETPPPIIFGTSQSQILQDTIYTLSAADIPSADPQNILIEDMTGVRCSNCPKAANAAKQVKDTFGNRVVVLGLYSQSPSNLTFPYSGFEDLRTEESQLIGSNIFNFQNQLPAGGVNRKLFSGQSNLNYDYKLWLNGSIQLYNTKSIVNMELTKKAVNDSTFDIGAKLVFTEKPDYNPFVSIALLENNIAHPQIQPDGSDDLNYVHQHVLRKMYTPYNGSPIFSAGDIQPDRGVVVERVWQIVIPENVTSDEASVAIFLNYNDANSKEVIQCLEIKLK